VGGENVAACGRVPVVRTAVRGCATGTGTIVAAAVTPLTVTPQWLIPGHPGGVARVRSTDAAGAPGAGVPPWPRWTAPWSGACRAWCVTAHTTGPMFAVTNSSPAARAATPRARDREGIYRNGT
jgi:hypothetical protein